MARRPAPAPPPPASTRPPTALVAAVVAVVVLILGVVVYLAVRGDGLEAQGGSGTLPAGGGIVVGAESSADAPRVTVYEDFQCPFCGDLERSVGGDLMDRAEAGELEVTYSIMSFLDGALGNDSSSRAANAAVCASDAGVFPAWHGAAFANQPVEGAGYTDEDLVGFAEQAGLSGTALEDFGTCVSAGTHLDYVADMQEASNRAGVSGTPTVLVDGERVDDESLLLLMNDPDSLDQVLEATS